MLPRNPQNLKPLHDLRINPKYLFCDITPTEQILGKKKHPHQLPDSPIAQARNAADAGFYLEAISIWETLISNDLEQYLNLIQGSNVSFSSLGKLLNKLDETLRGMKRSAPEDELYQFIEALHDWFGACHTAIHRLAKNSNPEKAKWAATYQPLKRLAKEGKKHFIHINNLTHKIRQGNQPA